METIYEESFGIIPLKQVNNHWEVFVILHKEGNHWGFPKGKADAEESPQESAIRELEEETGLIVENFLIEQPISEQYTFYRNQKRVEKKVFYFPAVVSGEVSLQEDEIRDGRWFSFKDALKTLTFDEAKRVCHTLKERLDG